IAAKIAGIGKNRIDDKRQIVVVFTDRKSNGLRVLQSIPATNRPPLAALFLVYDWPVKTDFIRTERKNQFTCFVDLDLVRTVKTENDAFRPRVRCNHKIVFQLPLVAVIDEIDSRIDIVDLNF